MMSVVRWRGFVPLTLVLALLVVGWVMFLDRIVERSVEEVGTRVVGARVDLDAANVRVGAGQVTLRGLAVTNPNAPMTNLFEADEIVADVLVLPLLETKVVVETLAVRGVRFGTPRETSGELANPPPGSGALLREVNAWADRVTLPSFSLEGLRGAVNVEAIRPESLASLRLARQTVGLADSMQASWRAQVNTLDPRPVNDSARALVQQLRDAQPLRLGPAGVTSLVRQSRSSVQSVERMRANLTGLDSTVRLGIGSMAGQVNQLAEARRADYAYARGLLKLPSLDAPDVSPSLFGAAALSWVQPVLYWTRLVGEYLPPGLDPRRRPGPTRVRQSGITVQYPGRQDYPKFWLRHADVDFVLGGTGVAAGAYAARLSGVTTAPTLIGEPIVVAAERRGAGAGPRDVRLAATLNHLEWPVRDSVGVVIRGITLPSVDIAPLGVRLQLGEGMTDLSLNRVGDSLAARWVWRGENVSWVRLGGDGPGGQAAGQSLVPSVGPADIQDLLWRTVSALNQVQIEVRLNGPVTAPAVGVSSNVGSVIAQSLRRELGREIEAAERRLRSQVDALVAPQIEAARTQVAALESGVRAEVEGRLAEVRQVEEQLKAELDRLLARLPPGFRP